MVVVYEKSMGRELGFVNGFVGWGVVLGGFLM